MSSSGTKGSDNRTYYYDKNTGSTKVVDSGGKTVYSGGLNSPTPTPSKPKTTTPYTGSYADTFNQGGVVNMRDYMSSYGQTPGWDANTGTITIGGQQYTSGNIPGTYFDAGTGYHYVNNPTAFNSLLNINTTPDPVNQPQIMPLPKEEKELQFMMPDMSMYDTSQYIGQLADAQRASRIAALDKARGNAMTALDTEQANIAPVYYDKRNQAAAQSDVGAMNFAQYMAARGIRGAAGAMPEIYRNAGLQGQIGALDRQEGAQLGAIERQRSNIESGYASDIAAAEADIQSQAMQNAINQMNADREFAMQRATQEWEINRANEERKRSAEDAIKQEWISTIGQYANDYQAQINAIQNDGDPTNDWQIAYLQAARQNKVAGQDEASAKAAQQEFENQLALARLNKPSGGSGGSGGSAKAPNKSTLTAEYKNYLDSLNSQYAAGMALLEDAEMLSGKGLNAADIRALQSYVNNMPSAADQGRDLRALKEG